MTMNDSGVNVEKTPAMPNSSSSPNGASGSPITPPTTSTSTTTPTTTTGTAEETASTITVSTAKAAAGANFPPPKTDKPRPHVCGTCQRSFARLEHLKRHERSHTKEKPFACPECSRRFARRDLLLRHQQKLHQTTTPSSRPRNRRESAASATPVQSRARKNSIAGTNAAAAAAASASMRPRANTISHVDVQMLAAANASAARAMPGHNRHPSLAGLPLHHNMDHVYGGMSAAMGQRGVAHGLPKLETHSMHGMDFNNSNGLRTAPLLPFTNEFDFEGLLFGTPGSTINPNALHYNDSPQSMALDPNSPFAHGMADLSANQQLDDTIDWLSGFDHQMSFHPNNENAVDGSSPSAISTTSQSGISDVMLDGSNHAPPVGTSSMWQPASMGPPQMPHPFALDLSSSVFPDLMNGSPMSPQPAHQKLSDTYFSTPPSSMTSMSPTLVNGMTTASQNLNQALSFSTATENPTAHHGGSQRSSPGPHVTEATRNAIVNALNQRPGFGRKYSMQQAPGSPLSPQQFQTSPVASSDLSKNLPSTQDLQRYVGAYLRYFHPHIPFLHIPTLSFDVSRPSSSASGRPAGIAGVGCLILSMGAIGAQYELDHAQSRDLFEMSKRMVQQYLEERRKADVRKADCLRTPGSDVHSQPPQEVSTHTPVWLVQAMLLNVVYGHNCGDKTASDIASTHCAALVSLAQGADLLRQTRVEGGSPDTPMGDDASWNRAVNPEPEGEIEWKRWKTVEERKRTLFGIFVLSSLLVSAYNHPPAITNSEILLDLPCDERYFSANSAAEFHALGGAPAAAHNRVSFHEALGELLRTSEKQKQAMLGGSGVADMDEWAPASDLNTSTFGCLILINALHAYIWETRQRHHNRTWTGEEMDTMHRHLEPALKAWQMAWIKGANAGGLSFGLDQLPADSVPLLEMAQIRLFVNLSRSKDKFWKRDWEGVAEELARGDELGQQRPESTPESNTDSNSGESSDRSISVSGGMDSPATQVSFSHDFAVSSKFQPAIQTSVATTTSQPSSSSPPQRERYLRRAAFYAAESLCVTAKQGAPTDLNVHRFSLQLAMCTFECAQVLAEWVATLQDRVGPYLGILGQDDVDLTQVPAIMLLEDEDVRLLNRVQEFIGSMESKLNMEVGNGGGHLNLRFPIGGHAGYGVKILQLTANVLTNAAVWPIMHLMADCLEAHANFTRSRSERSIRSCE